MSTQNVSLLQLPWDVRRRKDARCNVGGENYRDGVVHPQERRRIANYRRDDEEGDNCKVDDQDDHPEPNRPVRASVIQEPEPVSEGIRFGRLTHRSFPAARFQVTTTAQARHAPRSRICLAHQDVAPSALRAAATDANGLAAAYDCRLRNSGGSRYPF